MPGGDSGRSVIPSFLCDVIVYSEKWIYYSRMADENLRLFSSERIMKYLKRNIDLYLEEWRRICAAAEAF